MITHYCSYQVITGSGDRLSLNMKVKISVGDTWGTLTPFQQTED